MNSKTIKKLFLFMALIFIVTGCNFQQPDQLKMISATELNQIMKNEDIFLVDVHTPEQPHIKGTDIFIPYDDIEQYQDKFPKDKNTAIYIVLQRRAYG